MNVCLRLHAEASKGICVADYIIPPYAHVTKIVEMSRVTPAKCTVLSCGVSPVFIAGVGLVPATSEQLLDRRSTFRLQSTTVLLYHPRNVEGRTLLLAKDTRIKQWLWYGALSIHSRDMLLGTCKKTRMFACKALGTQYALDTI